MTEGKKRGRPKKNAFAENTPNNANTVEQNTVPKQGNSFMDDEDDLKTMFKNRNKVSESSNINIEEEALKEIENFDKKTVIDDIPDEPFNPLNEPVKQRSYTGGINNDFAKNYAQERVIEEPIYRGGGTPSLDIDEELINPNHDIPSSNNQKGKIRPPQNQNNPNPSQSQNQTQSSDGSARPAPEPEDDNLKNLSTKEKREAMEKTADAILLAYRNYVPLPFIYFSSYDSKKLEQLHKKDEINLDTQVKRDGTTFREYAKEFNLNVETAFTVTDAEVEALKDPLVDVLMEKDIALTPTQRLLFTAGQLLVAKVMLTVKFLREKKSDMEEMKQIHKEKMEAIYNELEREERRRNASGAKATQSSPPPPASKPSENLKVVKDEDDEDDDSTNISDAKIIMEESKTEKTEPSLDDVLNLNDEQDNNDIPE